MSVLANGVYAADAHPMPCAREVVLSALSDLAPLHLAESWDNVGLVLDPGDRDAYVRALVTIDLTNETLSEADELGVDLVVSYHPPIFSGLKHLRAGVVGEDLIVRALRSGITIYSPHTALDAIYGGMTDWLAKAAGAGETCPIVPHPVLHGSGAGRLVKLFSPVSLDAAVARVKTQLGLRQVRLSRAAGDGLVRSVAVCPGAGGSVFENVAYADLLITGEMRHHDVLARRTRGTHVILTDHTNTERGYLPHFAENLQSMCSGLVVTVSSVDVEPLQIV